MKVLPVQQQRGGVDCGLFAIAFVNFIAATQQNPINIWSNQTHMRNHALKCLKYNIMHSFPQGNLPGIRCKEKEIIMNDLDTI